MVRAMIAIVTAKICYTLTIGGFICIVQLQKPESADVSVYSRIVCHSTEAEAKMLGVPVCPPKTTL